MLLTLKTSSLANNVNKTMYYRRTIKLKTVPNQVCIYTHRLNVDKKNYTMMDRAAEQAAMNDLDKIGSLKLWLYMTKNKDQYRFALSPKDCESWGISAASYRSGKKDLEEKGYLVRRQGSNIVDFYEVPRLQNPALIEKQRQEQEDLLKEIPFITFEQPIPVKQSTSSRNMNEFFDEYGFEAQDYE